MRETTKHTPGPWENSHGTIMAAAGKVAEAGNPGYEGFAAESEHEAIANARLIAAAPDLLAACVAMAKYGADRIICHPDARNVVARDIAILAAAIARATGGAR